LNISTEMYNNITRGNELLLYTESRVFGYFQNYANTRNIIISEFFHLEKIANMNAEGNL
jgi:hypothetical protein